MNVDAYLGRIGLAESPPLTLEGLARLQRAHVTHVPFENIDLHLGRKNGIDPDALFQKIVVRRRGGWCFEVNELFALLLQALGFSVVRIAGRVWRLARIIPPARAHEALIVTLEGTSYLVDVGFGGSSPDRPLAFVMDVVQPADPGPFRLREKGEYGFCLEHEIDEQFEELYSFDLTAQLPCDFRYASYFLSSAPESHFLEHRMAALATPAGRLTLIDDRLTLRQGQKEEVHRVSEADYREVLRERFGILLDDDEAFTTKLRTAEDP